MAVLYVVQYVRRINDQKSSRNLVYTDEIHTPQEA